MIHDAIDAAFTLGWALLAWIAVLAAVGSIVLLAGTAVGMWAVRGAWRVLSARLAASNPPQAPREPQGADKASRARTGRRVPSWAHTEPYTYEEAA